MARTNPINIVLLERCGHPLTGTFPDRHQLDDPLDAGQVRMLRTAVDIMTEHLSDDARGIVDAMAGDDHVVGDDPDAGEARRLAGLIDVMWQATPAADRARLGAWFNGFNSAPERRADLADRVTADACDLAPD